MSIFPLKLIKILFVCVIASKTKRTEMQRTVEDGAQVEQIFALFDQDDDGKITASELPSLLRALNRAPTDEQLKSLTEQYPTHITASDVPAILALVPPINSEKAHAELTAAFQVLDREGTGLIASEELKRLVMTVGDKLSQREAEEMLKLADPENKGIVEYEKFIKRLILSD